MPALPTIAQLLSHFSEHGFVVSVYKQRTGSHAVIITKDGKKSGIAIKPLTTRLLKAALIKLKRKNEDR